MKKIILLLFCFSAMLFANIYDTKTIQEDFKAGNTDKYNYDTLPLLDKNVVKIKYLAATGAGSYISAVPDVGGYTTPSSNILEVFKCPKGGMGYSTTVYSVDFATLSMTCMVARAGALEKPLGLFAWNLKDYGSGYEPWVQYFQKNIKKAAIDNEDIINASKIQFSGLEAARVGAENGSLAADANTNIPKVLISTILGDTEVIDIQSSINHNSVVLAEGQKMKGSNFLRAKNGVAVEAQNATWSQVYEVNASDIGGRFNWGMNIIRKLKNTITGSPQQVLIMQIEDFSYENIDKSSDVLVSRFVNILEFFPKFSQLNQDFYMLMLGVFGLAGLTLIGAAKTAHLFGDDDTQNQNRMMWMAGVITTAVLFFPTKEQPVTIDDTQYHISSNNFAKIERVGYGTASYFADEIAKIVIDSEMKSISRKAGAINSNTIIDVAASEEVIRKERIAAASALMYCRDTYHLQYTQQYGGKNFIFPKSEQYVYAHYVKKGLNPNIYDSVNNNGLMLLANPDKEYPKISLSACQKIEKKIDYLEKMSEKNKATLLAATDGVDERKIAMLEQLYHSQYGFLDEWGWLSIISLPTVTFKSENLEQLYLKQTDRATELLKKEDDGVLKDVVTSIPWYLIPGMSNIQNMFESQFSDISALAGPVGKIVGSVAGGLTGYYFAVQVAQNLVEILPILGIVMISLLIILKIIIKIFTYHLMAPFVMLLAFSKQNVQLVLNYVARVITIMFEIPIFVLSVYAAMSARDILLALGTPMSSAVLKIMSEITEAQNDSIVHNMLDYLAQGAIEVTLQIFAFIIIYKILSTYHTMIFEAIEAKTASALDDVVTSTQQSAVNYGQRL